jgi:chromosome segregation ATPase
MQFDRRFLQALQLQASTKAELAQLPGLQDRLAVLQQQLMDAEAARAAAQQALLESTDKLQRAQRRSTALSKVCLQCQQPCLKCLVSSNCTDLVVQVVL